MPGAGSAACLLTTSLFAVLQKSLKLTDAPAVKQDYVFRSHKTRISAAHPVLFLLTWMSLRPPGAQRQFSSLSVYFTFQTGGKIAVNHDISAVSVELYARGLDYFRACLEIIVAIMVFFNIYT